MANVSYWLGTWLSAGPGDDLPPGATHDWIMWGFGYGEAISVSAHPVVGAPEDRVLAVENVRIEGDPGGRRMFFTVRNAGPSFVPGYGIGYGFISQ
ncbi:MAG TPA: hypothetical protein VKF32_05100 [Thermoanaerobaculia bacterium]|nr:hypothetical protein [Thermoanaerobaculia bacterium]